MTIRDWPGKDKSRNTTTHAIETTIIILCATDPYAPIPIVMGSVVMAIYFKVMLTIMDSPDGKYDVAANLLTILFAGIYILCAGITLLMIDSAPSWLPLVNLLHVFSAGMIQGLIFRDEFDELSHKMEKMFQKK